MSEWFYSFVKFASQISPIKHSYYVHICYTSTVIIVLSVTTLRMNLQACNENADISNTMVTVSKTC